MPLFPWARGRMLNNTFFTKLFGRSSPDKRLSELDSLSSANPEHLSRLRELSHDDDPQIRLAAARLIGLRDPLCKLLISETDPDVRRELISDLFSDVDETVARETAAVLARHLADDTGRKQLMLELPSAPAVGVLIQHSSDPSLAIDIACNHRISAVRVAAAQQVSDLEQLQQLSRSARDKSVQQWVRTRLRELREAQAASDEAAGRVDRLISASAKLIESADTVDYGARLQVLRSQFDELAATLDDDKRHVIERNLRRCGQRAAQLQHDDAATPAAESTPSEAAFATTTAPDGDRGEPVDDQPVLADEPVVATSEAHEALLDTLRTEWRQLNAADASACSEFVTRAATQWQSVSAATPSPAQQSHFDELSDRADSAQRCLAVLAAHRNDIDALLERNIDAELPDAALSDAQDRLADWFAELDWPQDATPPDTLAKLMTFGQALATEQRSRREARQQVARKIDRMIYRLRGQVQRKQLKAALHSERDIAALLDTADDDTRHAAERKLAGTREGLSQLKDWEDFRVQPLRETLCEKMEALGSNSLPPDAQAEAVKSLRQEWRSISRAPLDKNDPVQLRFQTAADTAFAHCAEWHEAQQAKRRKNLAERERLVSELQTFVDSLDSEAADLDVIQRAMRASRDEWRHYYPVRHSDARDCQKQFDALMDGLHKRIKQGHKQNKAARDGLITEAESLLQQDDLDQAIGRAIELQAAWKDVGPVTPRDQRRQWTQFRQPMDALFARRSNARKAQKAEVSAQQSVVEDLISELRALADDNSQPLAQRLRAAEDIRGQIDSELAALQRRDAQKLGARADGFITQLHAAQREAPKQRKITQLNALASLARTLSQLETQRAAGEAVDTAPFKDVLDEQLGAATAARALLDQRVDALEQPLDTALAQRQSDALASLLVEIEILTDLPTPDGWRAERRACQIEMLEDRQNAASEPDAVLQLVTQALATGPLAPDTPDAPAPLDADARLRAVLDSAPRWLD